MSATLTATDATAQTTTWTTCATEGKTCSFSGSRQVRYGANGIYATRTATSSILCSNSVFGDPVKYVAKSCGYATTTTTTPDPDPDVNVGTSPGPGVFVDSVGGSDSNAGTFAKPWKTLSKLAGAKVATNAGVYLKCGSVFRETLNLGSTQLQDGSIVAGYGTCSATSKAIITGANSFTGGWTKSGNIWSVNVPTSTPKITQLFVNGEAQRTAQWPNYGGLSSQYAIADTSSPAGSKTVLKARPTDLAALSGKDMVNAGIMVRVEPFYIDKRVVGSYNASTGQIGLTAATSYGMEAGDGFVLQDKKWMLDAPGEFFHDQAQGKLYVYPSASGPQASLNSYGVEGTVRDIAVQLNTRARLAVRNIGAVKSAKFGLVLSNTAAAVVDSVDVSDNGTIGVSIVRSSAGTILRNSTLKGNAHTAVDSRAVSGVRIENNQITNTGMSAYAGNTGHAIAAGPGGITTRNFLSNTAYVGIGFSGTGGSQVTKNVIQDSCQRLSDGSAIYTWNGGNATANQSSLIEGNVVARAPANTEGSVGGAYEICMGIYTDEYTRSATIRGNTVIDMMIGIKVHNSYYTTVESNKVWLTSRTALWLNMDHKDKDAALGNVFRNNQLNMAVAYTGTYPQVPWFNTDNKPIWFWHAIGGLAAIQSGQNSFSGNELLMLNGDSAAAATVRGPSGMVSYSTSEWRKLNTSEPAPRLTSEFSTYTATYGPELVSNGDFLSGMTGWGSWFAAAATKGTVSIAAATGCLSTCAVLTASTPNDVLSTPAFSMTSGALHRLKFHAAMQNNGAINRPQVPAGTGLSSFTNMSDTAGSTLSYEGFVTSKTAVANKINFSATPGTRVGFDAVSVKRVTGYKLARTSDWASYAYASPNAGKTVTCADLRWPTGCTATDGNGVGISIPFTLAAGEAKLVLRRDSEFRVK